MLSAETEQKIEKIIAQEDLVPKDVLEEAKTKAETEKKTLIQVLTESGAITEDQSAKIIAFVSNTPFADLSNIAHPVSQEILSLIPKDIAQTYMAVPFGITDGKLNVAMVDPTNLQAIDFLTRKTGYSINAYMATKSSIENILSLYKDSFSQEVQEAIGGVSEVTEESKKQLDSKSVQVLVQDAPITRALNAILEYAVKSKASDIHIEPRQRELKVRFRIDGILHDTMTLPKNIEPALVSRIKILSNLKIDEHRTPQDGEAQIEVDKKEVDLRIAIAPITYGEQVVIRVLDKSAMGMTLDKLGFRGRAYRLIKEGMSKPHGMILSTGPTGSGKSTTLYAVIQEIISEAVNIVTLEDPVEYKIDGVNQIQVNPGVGLTFASGLRSILRQDPNIIMVGEIRDKETAELAVQSALTGHTVLSTLHTNSASGALPRMLDMELEPFLVASTVNTVIGQRLVRKICEKCKVSFDSSESATKLINKILGDFLPKDESDKKSKEDDYGYSNLPLYSEKAYTLYKGKGCPECQDGMQGRTGVFEVFEVNPSIEKLLASSATTSQVQAQAQADGMLTMQQDGLLKALTGITTIEEVARVASE